MWIIELCRLDLANPCILEFFQKQGPNIYSLSFRKCKLEPEVLRKIVDCCERLSNIVLFYCHMNHKHSENDFCYLKIDIVRGMDLSLPNRMFTSVVPFIPFKSRENCILCPKNESCLK